MKKLLLSTALLLVMTLTFSSCRDNKKADSIEEAIENAGDALEEAADETGEAIEDAVDATEDALEEAGDAIDKKVDEIKAEN